jgi:hypothetical protein
MRFIFSKNNQTEAILNDYQSRLRTSNWPAYTGSLGVAMLIGGPIYANTLHTPLGQRDTRNIFIATGVTLLVGSYFYGQWSLHKRENILEKGIQTYNDSVPEPERIQVGLTPTPTGDGGTIKTIVPF